MTRALTLALAGDVMLGRLMNEALENLGPEAPWEAVKPLLDGTDAFIYNLECAVCGDLPEWEPVRKTFHFRMDPAHLATLHASGVSAVGLANNHVLDHGVAGLCETLDHLDASHIPHAGAGRSLDEARAPALVETPAGTVGLVQAADHLAEWAAGPDVPGIFLVDPGRPGDADDVTAAARAARDAGADWVVAGLHWGPNMRREPRASFQHFAHRIMDGGAVDVLWGTSAHIPQGIEFHPNGVILYDTGDFLDDYAVDPALRNDLSFLYRLRLEPGGGVGDVAVTPMRIHRFRTRPATAEDAAFAVDVLTRCSRAFGTRVTPRGSAWVARPADG